MFPSKPFEHSFFFHGNKQSASIAVLALLMTLVILVRNMIAPKTEFVNFSIQCLKRAKQFCAAKILKYMFNRLQVQLKNVENPFRHWIVISQKRIAQKLQGEYGFPTVRKAIALLVDWGLLILERKVPGRAGRHYRYLLAASRDETNIPSTLFGEELNEDNQKFAELSDEFSGEARKFNEDNREKSDRTALDLELPPKLLKLHLVNFEQPRNAGCESDSNASANNNRSKNKNIESTEKKLTRNKLEISKRRTRENPLPKRRLKQKSKTKKSGKATKCHRWGQKFREFDEKFRDIVTKYLSDSCTPKDIARCASEGIDRSRECEINDTVIDYCVRAGVDTVKRAIAVCKRDMEKNFIKKPAAFLVRKIQGLLASEGLLAEEEYPRQLHQLEAATPDRQEFCKTRLEATPGQEPCKTNPEKNPPQEAAIANWPECSEADRNCKTGDKAIPQPRFQTHHLSNPYPEGDKAMDKTHLRFQTHHLSNVCRRPDGRIDKPLVLWLFELRRKQFDTANQFDVENELNNDGDKASRAWESFREEMTQRVINFSERLAAASANPEHARNFLTDCQEIAAIAPYAYPEQISGDALFFLAPYIDLCAERPPGINNGIGARIKAIAINSRQEQQQELDIPSESLLTDLPLTVSATRSADAESLATREVEQSIPELPDGSDRADNSLAYRVEGGAASLEEPTEKYGNPQQNLARLAKMVSSVKVDLSGFDATDSDEHLTKQQAIDLEDEPLNCKKDDAPAQKKAEARLMWQQFYADARWVELPPTQQEEPDAAKIQRLWSDPGLRDGLIRAIAAHPQWGLQVTDGELDF